MSPLNKDKPEAYIFGAGQAGKAALRHLNSDYTIIGFIDNDQQKLATLIDGVEVYSPDVLNSSECAILIASEYFEQIETQLIKEGIFHQRIIRLPARFIKPMTFESSGEDHGINVLKSVCDIIEEHDIRYHVDAGTLLGLYRDGQLIPWDDDLDIAILSDDIDTLVKSLPSMIDSLHRETGSKWRSQQYFSDVAFGNVPIDALRSIKLYSDLSHLPNIDFFIKYVVGDYSDYCLASRGIRMPAKYIACTHKKILGTYDWRVPVDCQGYLRDHYGEDWHIPNPDWSLQNLDNSHVFKSGDD